LSKRPATTASKQAAAVKPAARPAAADGAELPTLTRPAGAWVRFWFTPTDPIGLHALRVLAGLLFLCWLLPFAGSVEPLYGLTGWFDLRAYADFGRGVREQGGSLPLNWSLLYQLGEDPTTLAGIYWTSLAVLVLFTVGLWPRLTAVLAWVVVASFLAGPAILDDADWILPILALYLMVGYILAGQLAPDRPASWRVLGPLWPFGRHARDPFWHGPSAGANVAVRLIQVHFALVMVVSALHKLQFGDWWGGLALWYPLHPPLDTRMSDILALRPHTGSYLFLLSLATYAGLAWQLCFPLFAWRTGWWRVLFLGGAVVGCLSMAFVYQLPVFGPALVVFCLAYLTPAEWRRVTGWLAELPGLVWRRPASADTRARRGRPDAGVTAMMAITCPGCQAQLKVPEALRGRKAKCDKCATVWEVPAAASERSPAAPR
jgi:predicted Zn finger-like uncharacterized protein